MNPSQERQCIPILPRMKRVRFDSEVATRVYKRPKILDIDHEKRPSAPIPRVFGENGATHFVDVLN